MLKNSKGIAALEIVVISAVVLLLAGASWYFVSANQKPAKQQTENIQTSAPKDKATKENLSEKAAANEYLKVPEMGIKLKLTENTKDAYYRLSERKDENGRPEYAMLSTKSLDAFPECTAYANHQGIASISKFKPGATDPVHGNFSESYPDAATIDGYGYFIAGNQYDCTMGKATELYAAVKKAFLESYPDIEPLR